MLNGRCHVSPVSGSYRRRAARIRDVGANTIAYSRIVDSSHLISPNLPLWPGGSQIEMETVASFDTDGNYLRRFSIGEHSANHMNAPNSFHEVGFGINGYPPGSLVVSAVVIDAREQSAAYVDYQLNVDGILEWESLHGSIADGTVVIMFTGRLDRWSDQEAFLNEDAHGGLQYPWFQPIDYGVSDRRVRRCRCGNRYAWG